MKKIMAIVCAVVMALTCAACGGTGNNGPSAETEKAEIASCEDLLNQVWNTFAEDEKFAAMGGDMNNTVDGAAGNFDLADTENLIYMLHIPEENIAQMDEAASLIHMMNANTFTGAAFHLENSDDVDVFVESLKENIMGTQWMCGFPDTLNIFVVNGEYVVSAFGNADIMENFKTKLNEVFGDSAVIVVEESLI
ncbi:MAG: hypothetical protein II251_00570 [Lachnospiraceae bacterium]|nr:hypothetical protein [Lachnospiraceae bacterium]